ncbi:MAG: T9SS type A sorting domain-containing protein, partial [Bacteroidia bacterium]|nr:T9SS type A sorting domain-containing protein [Bacteroidia bacterium]
SDYDSPPFIAFPCTTCTSQTLTNKYKVINDITIGSSQELVLEGCHLAIEPDVKITVASGGTLIIRNDGTNNSHLFPCSDMWNGIIVEPGGILVIEGNITDPSGSGRGTLLQGATTAIDVNGGTLQIYYAEFDHNLQSIYVRNNPNTDSYIYGSKFKCSGAKIGKGPFEEHIPLEHVRIENVTNFQFPIGTSSGGTGNKNYFSNAYSAIGIYKSSVIIQRNYFDNIYNHKSFYHSSSYGQAINVVGSPSTTPLVVDIGGTGANEPNYFTDTNIGVRVSNANSISQLVIAGNEFENTSTQKIGAGTDFYNTAITVQNPLSRLVSQEVSVFGNAITDCRIGIHARNIPDISIGSKPTLSAPNIINFNQTEFNDHHCGIWVENSNGAKVQDNELHQSSTATPSGSYTVEGITIDNCQNAVLTSNELYELYSPIRLKNTCLLTELHCNDIDNDLNSGGTGVNIDGADISTQGINQIETWDNTWKGYSSSIHGIVGTPGQPTFWYFNSSLNDGNPFPASNSVTALGISPTTVETCSLNIIIDVHERDVQFGDVAADAMNYSFSAEELEYKSRTHLFNLIKSDTTLLTKSTSKDSLFRNFYSGIEQLNIGLFHKIDSLILVGNLDAASDLNNSITDSLEWESNLKAVYSIIITKTLRDSLLNASDTTMLEGIAIQNPLDGGKAVFLARALLFWEIHDATFSSRIGSVNSSLNITQPTDSSSIQLFPNPSNDQCQVLLTGIKKAFVLRIQNMVGKDIYLKSIAPQITLININTSYMAPGMYMLTVTDGVEFFKQEKLIISR